MRLHWEPITLDLKTTFRVAHGASDQRHNVLVYLDDGETTVGTHVCVSHEAAVLEGEEFEIVGRLTTVNRRRLTFDVEVTGPRGPVSRGTHERAVVSLDRMG